MDDLFRLAELIRAKNNIDGQISQLIGRPALIGHVGEYIAAQIFDIQLVESAANKAIDGYFCTGPLAGKSVNVKWYPKQDGLLAIKPDSIPDYFLILSGPITPAASSRGTTRPWVIDHVYLFNAVDLVARLRLRGIKFSEATSIIKSFWEAAEIYPWSNNMEYRISSETQKLLKLFQE